MIHIEIKRPNGARDFTHLAMPPGGGPIAVQNSIVAYRDQVWPQGINLIYSWSDELGTGLPTVPPAGYTPAFDQVPPGNGSAEEEAEQVPWAAVGVAAVVILLLFSGRKRG